MNCARLNLAHGSTEEHREDIRVIRSVAGKMDKVCPILVDLPGPKIRIGRLPVEPLILKKGDRVILDTDGDSVQANRIPVEYKKLPESVSRGGTIYLNDGFIQLRVMEVSGEEVRCLVVMGGPLLSHKGLNLPKARISATPVTDEDLALIDFGLKERLNMFSLSFIEKADDIIKAKEFAKKKRRPDPDYRQDRTGRGREKYYLHP
jgi:pyruvate kinase